MKYLDNLFILLRKIRTLICMCFALPVVLFTRLARPFLLIRFGPLASERIGTFAGYTDMYLCRRKAGLNNPKALDFFYCRPTVSNRQLKKMWSRVIPIWPFARWVDALNRRIPGGAAHTVPRASYRDTHGFYERMPPHIAFTDSEERLGRGALRRMGIPEGAPFVCMHARDSLYLKRMYPGRDWTYHDFRDSDIENYKAAAEELAERGYFVLRMGQFTEKPLGMRHPMIIDYAVKYRTDFLDIYLGARCRFFLGNTAGLYAVSDIFRRPIVYVNNVPIEYTHTWGPGSLFIPKKLRLRGESRLMTFREMFDTGVSRFLKKQDYERLDIETIENTPDEIRDIVCEMDERLKGSWRPSREDDQLQKTFWSVFRRSELNGVFLTRLGARFLRENRELLEEKVAV